MKRKPTITLMILMLIIALCGCSSKSANTIQLWDPAEEQAQAALEILTSGGHSAFAAYEVDKSYQTLKMGIEYYQDVVLCQYFGHSFCVNPSMLAAA